MSGILISDSNNTVQIILKKSIFVLYDIPVNIQDFILYKPLVARIIHMGAYQLF